MKTLSFKRSVKKQKEKSSWQTLKDLLFAKI